MVTEMYFARFAPGQIVRHRQEGYRGIIYDVDAVYGQTDAWYELMAVSRPSKNYPWYHILVDGEEHTTYVAEENLQVCMDEDTFDHPQLGDFFQPSPDGLLPSIQSLN